MVLALAAVVLVGFAVLLFIGEDLDYVPPLENPASTDPVIVSPVLQELPADEGFGVAPTSADSGETVRVKLKSRIKSISGMVLDGATGLPVEGVYVVAQRKNAAGSYDYDDSADTDAAGAFRLMKLKDTDYEIVACHADYEEASVVVRPGDEDLVIRLTGMPAYSVYGTVQDDQGVRQPNIVVELYSQRFKESHQTRTSAKGAYGFKGMPPGLYRLSTEEPRDPISANMYFTGETKDIEIVDRDLCIHFGTDTDNLAWKGVLYDLDGNPICGAEIEIDQVGGPCLDRCTNGSGAFYFSRLKRGRYRLRVELPGGQVEDQGGSTPFNIRWSYHQLDDVVFDKPGIHEKDIRLSGAVLSGVIIDERTGAPVCRESCPWLRIRATLQDGRHYYCEPAQGARFRFKGVPPGTYTFRAEGGGRAFGYLEDVQVKEGSVIEDLRIPLPRYGVLSLHIHGIYSRRGYTFTIRVEGPHPQDFGHYWVKDNGEFKRDFNLEVGTWRLILGTSVSGRIERDFTIYDERVSEVSINGQDYQPR
jgi:protocatechuate 3,4-dioxygenase beta subunit